MLDATLVISASVMLASGKTKSGPATFVRAECRVILGEERVSAMADCSAKENSSKEKESLGMPVI